MWTLELALGSLSKRPCRSLTLSARDMGQAIGNKKHRTVVGHREGVCRLYLHLRGLCQHMNALIRLPHLIGILVFIERQEFPIGIEGGLNLTKFIVAESPNKPRAGSGCLSFRNYVQGAQ